MKTGLIIGKFYPPHLGHDALIERAVKECDRVIILLLWSEQESISAAKRVGWLSAEHPKALVFNARDEFPVDYESDVAWENHIGLMRQTIRGNGYDPWCITHVYGADAYVHRLATYFEAAAVIDRRFFNLSATQVRAAPRTQWHRLGASVKAGLCKRVVCIGAESTGTTTLARDLAGTWDTVWVPEYGRLFSEGLVSQGNPQVELQPHVAWTHDDLYHIAMAQNALENRLAKHSRYGLLICDTNVLATKVWHEFLVGGDDLWVVTPRADLYILTDLSCPFEDDGLRNGKFRGAMHLRFADVLENQDVPWITVTGSPQRRLTDASAAIEDILHWNFADPIDKQ